MSIKDKIRLEMESIQNPEAVAPLTPEEIEQVREQQVDLEPVVSLSSDEPNTAELAKVDDRQPVTAAIAIAEQGVRDAINTSPALMGPVVDVVNSQLQDAGRAAGVEAPQLAIDPQTYELTKESMESVTSWLGDLFKSVANVFRNRMSRFGIGFDRTFEGSTQLSRAKTALKLLPRRKHPEGGNVIKLKEENLTTFVKGDVLLPTTLNELAGQFDFIRSEFANTRQILTDAIAKSKSNIGGLLVGNFQSVTDIANARDALTEHVAKLNNLHGKLLGNREVKINRYSVTPVVGHPNPSLILKTNPQKVSLSSEDCNNRLIVIGKMLGSDYQPLKAMVGDIDQIVYDFWDDIPYVDRSEDNRSQNQMRSNLLQLAGILEDIYYFVNAYHTTLIRNCTHAISQELYLIEESILQD